MTNKEARLLLLRARSLLSAACWNGMCCDLRAEIDTALATEDAPEPNPMEQAKPCEHAILLHDARTALVRSEFMLRTLLAATIGPIVERIDKPTG